MTSSKARAPREEAKPEESLRRFLAAIARFQPDRERIVFVCVGTDRSTGDALGPLVGTLLSEHGWSSVIGTLAEPCDAGKVESAAAGLRQRSLEGLTVIAIDACLGKPQSVGGFELTEGPLRPGAATGCGLPQLGDFGIAGIVNRHGPKAYVSLQTTSLHLVMEMARQIFSAINETWYINHKP